MSWWLILVVLLLNLVLLPYFVLTLATAIAAISAPKTAKRANQPRSRFLVVIPAHDEEMGIAATVRSCLSLDYPAELFEVVVIADNCTDGTAEVARREGATVVRRDDSSRKSKGYRAWILDRATSAIRAVRDTRRTRGDRRGFEDESRAAVGVRRLLQAGHDWLQCLYTVSNPQASWRTRLMTYAFTLFNGVTPLGLSRLGLGAGFKGNGMCFSTKGLRRVPWASNGLVEDMEYSWTVRLAGETIAFVPDVEVSGVMLAQGGTAAAAQRQRWEVGRSEIRRRVLGPLIRSRRLGPVEKFLYFLELTMPSNVTFLAAYACLMVASLFGVQSPQPRAPGPCRRSCSCPAGSRPRQS